MSDLVTEKKILTPGRACWRIDEATASGLLVDACDYFRSFFDAAMRARRQILIAGWEFHSRVRLLRGDEEREAGVDTRFLPFLNFLCDRNPDLQIRLLAWDFGLVFFWAREWNQDWRFNQRTNPRVQFRFDDRHPIGASHHQKFAVIDNEVAFVGGADFCSGRWDDRRHAAANDLRDVPRKCGQHEVQAYVAGPAVAHVSELFVQRWLASGADPFPIVPAQSFASWTGFGAGLPIEARDVALSRTQGQTFVPVHQPVREIRRLHIDAIEAAGELVYIENQYYSSKAVNDALIRRMRNPDRPKLDIVLILPDRPKTLGETLSMGYAQMDMLRELDEVAVEMGHDLGLYYAVTPAPEGGEIPRYIHSKMMIVDDRLITVGSANTNNRSMGLDTELNLAWEGDEPAFVESVERARASLLVEHTGRHAPELRLRRGLVAALDAIARDPSSHLRPHPMKTRFDRVRWLLPIRPRDLSLDPESAIEEGIAEAHEPAPPARRPNPLWVIGSRIWRWAALGAAGAGLVYLMWSCF